MVTYDQFLRGLTTFIDQEIMPKMDGFKKLAFGVGSSIAIKKGENMFNLIRDNKLVHALEILDEQNNINIDVLVEEMKEKMGNEIYKIDIPMIGTISLDVTDLNKLYSLIKNS